MANFELHRFEPQPGEFMVERRRHTRREIRPLSSQNVEFVRIQWRKLYEGEWINAWNDDKSDADVQCNTARGQGCKLPWNIENQYFMNGLRDGTWEISSKSILPGYDSFATSDVKYSTTEDNLNLIVDVNQPLAVDASVLNVFSRLISVNH